MTHELEPTNKHGAPEETFHAAFEPDSTPEEVFASELSKSKMLSLAERLTAPVPEEVIGKGDLTRVVKKASFESPSWRVDVATFLHRGDYSKRGLAEIEITRNNNDGTQAILAVVLNRGANDALEGTVKEFELDARQAAKGIRPHSSDDFWERQTGPVVSKQDMLDLALGTTNPMPVRQGELLEADATAINTALVELPTPRT